MQIKPSIPLFLLLFINGVSHAQGFETDIIHGCKNLNYLSTQGQQQYDKKNYLKALEYFQEQASWTDFCGLHEALTGKKISESQLATAYNNVGLTYSKLNRPRWAKVWYSLLPKDSKSQFNLKKLGNIAIDKNKLGIYVKYIGQGSWDVLQVSTGKVGYDIDYSGLRMGLNGLVAGPNMGEFSTYMAKNQNQAEYRDASCRITLTFNQGENIQVKQNQADCGFGMGVYAGGNYVKVEKLPDYAQVY